MKELIKITTNEEGKQLVSARELHEFLEVGRDFTTWIKGRIKKYEFVENVDFVILNLAHQNGGASWGGSNKVDYALAIDTAKELSMIENNEKGREARRYFIECEKKAREVTRPQLPQDYLSALKALVESEEEKQRLSLEKAKIEEEKNRLIHQGKLYTTTEIAKELGFKSAKAFNEFLKEKKIQYKVNDTWVLAARFSELGYTEIKQTELDNGKIIYNRKWTGTGRDWLINEIMKGEC